VPHPAVFTVRVLTLLFTYVSFGFGFRTSMRMGASPDSFRQ